MGSKKIRIETIFGTAKNTVSIQAKKLNHHKGFSGSQRNPKGVSILRKDQPYSDFRTNQGSGDGTWTKIYPYPVNVELLI